MSFFTSLLNTGDAYPAAFHRARRRRMPDEVNRRHFPSPWFTDEATESFCIRDANGQALAYVNFEDESGDDCA